VAGNETDSGRRFRDRRMRARPSLRAAVRRDDPAGIHKNWRQTDSLVPHRGESLDAIARAPRFGGSTSEEERAFLDAVSGRAGLETWH
jgi:hypothetical protein